MKKHLPLILTNLFLCLTNVIYAQEDRNRQLLTDESVIHSVMRQPATGQNNTNALFDLQFDYVLPRGGFAGITWTDNDFWVSKWASDTVFVVDDASGALLSYFFIPGVSGIRGMTFDGTHVWATTNTTTIYKIDTATKTVITSITAPFDARGISWDSSANGGAGGLWIANYATDLTLIDTAGNTLSSIFAATHGLLGMYSIAYDPWSTGGPYIWAFDFGVAGNVQNLVRIPVATGVKDLVHDVGLEIGGAGIAGGLSITGFANPGPHTLLGLSQDSPDRVFGLELGDYTPPVFDASADTLYFNPPYTQTPSFLLTPVSWELASRNNGSSTLDTVYADLVVNDGVSNVFTASGYATSVAPLTTALVSIPGPFTATPTPGSSYTVSTTINTGIQTDQVGTNNTTEYNFAVTDTVMSRDNNVRSGRIGIGNGTGGSITQLFEMPVTAYATSATFNLFRPTIGDSIRAELYDWNGTTPNNLIASSATHIITADDTGGVDVTLPFLNAPVQMTPGTYAAGILEHASNVSISYSLTNWHPNTTWIYIAANGWRPSEDYNFNIVPFIDLNIWSQSMVSVDELQGAKIGLYPNPVNSQFTVILPGKDFSKLTVSDANGRLVMEKTIRGMEKEVLSVSGWQAGVYFVSLQGDYQNEFRKIIVAR